MFSSRIKGSLLLVVSIILLLAGNRATAAEIATIPSVSHVYMDGEFIGSVTDETKIASLVREKVREAESEYPEYTFNEEAQLTLVQENVFHADIDEEKTIQELKSAFTVKAQAYDIILDNQVVAHVSSKKDAQDVLEKIQLLYIDEEEWADYEATKKAGKSGHQDPLKGKESRILSVSYTEPVTWKESLVEPDEMMNSDETLSLIEEGKKEEGTYESPGDEDPKMVAEHFDMTLKHLLTLNPGLEAATLLGEGERVQVIETVPYVSVVVEREVLKETEVPYKRQVIKDKRLLKGDSVIEQEGRVGTKNSIYQVIESNGEKIRETLLKEEMKRPAQKRIIRKGTKVIPEEGSGTFMWPADGGYISSKQGHRWGKLHKGIDIARPTSRTIKAADHGIIEFAGKSGGYGNMVTINHNNGYKTQYAHLDSIGMKQGQKVEKGMKIGKMGSTGNSTGIHLHFEVYKDGVLANPMDYISQ